MFTFVGETVLDPFLGSGTTSLAAKNLNRNSIGYEINEKFLPIIKNKLKVSEQGIFGDATYEFIRQRNSNVDFSTQIKSLPYKFTDPNRFDKKVDPRKLKFGSKIENNDNGLRTEFYTVTNIISPEVLQLNNGLNVRLLGVTEDPHHRNEAIEFLKSKTKGQRVFLKFDSEKYDEAGNLLCYVYLKNKTFLNAHLIKSGFVSTDSKINYKYRNKFQTLSINERHR
jgi:site-specific DNA-methyltransferase (adenine-specific)